MRTTLLSRAARPKLDGTTISISAHSRASAIRQTRSIPSKRSITINDVFTLLLTPILATALLADTSWKDKRRKDWAAKIAEVEAETEQIQSRTVQAWQELQHRSLRLGAAEQRRHFSVASLRLTSEEEGGNVPEMRPVSIEDCEYEPEWFEAERPKTEHSTATQSPEEDDEHHFTHDAVIVSERVRRLLAVKLALNLTIYLNTGVSPSKIRKKIRIPELDKDFKFDGHYSQDLPTILRNMKDICSRIKSLNATLPHGVIPIRTEPRDTETLQLEDEICSLSHQLDAGTIFMQDLVSLYTFAVLKSNASPTSKAYRALFRALSRGSGSVAPSHDLAMQTLVAWEQSRIPIHEYDLWFILTELAFLKHVQKFDSLMRELTVSRPHINVIGKWTWATAGGTQVPVPASYHPAILMTLVHCALRFDQPEKAEAWSEILRRTWMNINEPEQKARLWRFFADWMRYWEVHGNWRKGLSWLDAAQKWTTTIASNDMFGLQRLIVSMLSVCFACGKSEQYTEILDAAVDSGIPSVVPEFFLSKSPRKAICTEWVVSLREAYRGKFDLRTDEEKIRVFQHKISLIVQKLLPEPSSPDIEWRQTQAGKPEPLSTNSTPVSSGQEGAEDASTWKRLYTENQEVTRNAIKLSEHLRSLYHQQGKELDALKIELNLQKKLLRDLNFGKDVTMKKLIINRDSSREAVDTTETTENRVENPAFRFIVPKTTVSRHERTVRSASRAEDSTQADPGYSTAELNPGNPHKANTPSPSGSTVEREPYEANWLDGPTTLDGLDRTAT